MKSLKMTEKVDDFLIDRNDVLPYPPHHTGLHLEEAFIEFWESEGKGERKLIPIHWTAVYNDRGKARSNLQNYLSRLDPNDKYFAVCTHDDAPTEILPPNTIVFGAGGNSNRIDIPIPLTCGPHKEPGDFLKTIPISFIASLTHPIRHHLAKELQGKPGVFMDIMQWTPSVPSEKVNRFKEVTQRSIFSLCPRGYGATSYRLYETMQLGAIPVYVSDKHLLPWSDEIDWSEFCVIVKPDNIHNIHQLLFNIPASRVRRMQETLSNIWEKHFSIETTCRHIEKRLS